MSNVEQNVKQFNDEDTEIILSATVDKREPEEWILITVGSEYISLSVKNWEIVKQLADKALSNSNDFIKHRTMFKLTGKAKEDFLIDLELDLPLEKILESMSDYELLMKQMMFFDKIVGFDFQHILKKALKNYHQGLFSQFVSAIEKANKKYNES